MIWYRTHNYIKDIEELDKIQRQAVIFLLGDYSWDSSASKMLKELEWKDLTDRRREDRLVMFYKIVSMLAVCNLSLPPKADID